MWVRVIVLICAVAVAERRRARDVRTTQGSARGYFAPDPPHFAFLGLPYAAVKTRFKAPEPPPRWDGIFEATHRIRCPQDGTGDENCLVVNVFAPEDASSLPVLVFVHDGQFQHGWGSYKPPSKLLSQGLVIVTFNYRLGPLGFLCLKIPGIQGNAGLKDQIAALYWVQMNIERFGGDPFEVTVYGIGSGAVAVQILLLSGLAKGLLHKAILESGSILSPTSLAYEPLTQALNVAIKLGYKSDDLDEREKLLQFFHSVPLRKLTNVSDTFLPCIESSYYYDHNLLEEDPIQILKQGEFQKVPVIIAYASNDGMSVVEENQEALNTIPDSFDMLLPNNLKIIDEQKKLRIAELVKEFYFDSIDGNMAKNYVAYFHDVLFEYPIMKFGVLYGGKSTAPVYMMKFMYKTVANELKKVLSGQKIIDYIYGDELLEDDEVVSDRLITLMCNFIRLGDPTPITTSKIPVIWKSATEGFKGPSSVTASVLKFDRTLTMITTYKNQHLTFWDHIYENFYKTHTPGAEELK